MFSFCNGGKQDSRNIMWLTLRQTAFIEQDLKNTMPSASQVCLFFAYTMFPFLWGINWNWLAKGNFFSFEEFYEGEEIIFNVLFKFYCCFYQYSLRHKKTKWG